MPDPRCTNGRIIGFDGAAFTGTKLGSQSRAISVIEKL